MIVFLRLVGVMNAAVWFGAAIFFTFGVAPAFFAEEFKQMLGAYGEVWAGLIAQVVLERYFVLNYCCGSIAMVHLLAEWVYLGKTLSRVTLIVLVFAFSLSLLGGLALQPKLKRLHLIKYSQEATVTPAQRMQAARSFRLWHGVSQVMNLLVLAGLGVYLWRVTHSSDTPRFLNTGKFRG